MSEAAVTETLLKSLKPRVLPELEARRNGDGRLVLSGQERHQHSDVLAHEEPLLDLLDGNRSLDELVRGALDLSPPIRPLHVMRLLRRLHRTGLVEGIDEAAATQIFELQRKKKGNSFLRFVSNMGNLELRLPFMAPVFSLGAKMPQYLWRAIAVYGLALCGISFVSALVVDLLGTEGYSRILTLLTTLSAVALDDPVHGLLRLYGVAALVLTARGIARGFALRSMDLEATAGKLKLLMGIVHLDVDDRARRAAARQERLSICWAGLAAPAAICALCSMVYFLLGSEIARDIAFVSVLLLLGFLAPYGRGDMWHLTGISARIPQMRRRSSSFLMRRVVYNVIRKRPVGKQEKTYLLVTSGWIGHALITLWVLGYGVLDGALDLLKNMLPSLLSWRYSGNEYLEPVVTAAAIFVFLMFAVLLISILGAFLMLAVGGVSQLWQPHRGSPPKKKEQVGEARAADFTEAIRRLPFLASLSSEDVASLVAQMDHEQHQTGALVIRQGEPGDRFCFLEAGRVEVVIEEDSGLEHRVAELVPGDFFGEVALLKDVPRSATVKALESVEILSLDRETLLALLERVQVSPEKVLEQVRNAAFLRSVPLFQNLPADPMRTLLEAVTVATYERGGNIVEEGKEGSDLYILREGACEVFKAAGDGEEYHAGDLEQGDFFGEIALLQGGQRTATVRAKGAVTVIVVPGPVFAELLLEDFQSSVDVAQTVARRLDATATA